MATPTAPKVENPKKTLAQPQSSDTTQPTRPEELQPLATTNRSSTASTAPPSLGAAAGKIADDAAGGGGVVTDTQKKIRRAERFGMPVHLSEQEKRDSRAGRFGTGPGSHGCGELKKSEELKRKARAERFGIVHPTSTDEDAKKKARLARFGPTSKPDTIEEDKRKARAIRFSGKQVSLTKENGKGNSEMKEAVLGQAGGGP